MGIGQLKGRLRPIRERCWRLAKTYQSVPDGTRVAKSLKRWKRPHSRVDRRSQVLDGGESGMQSETLNSSRNARHPHRNLTESSLLDAVDKTNNS
jgi:hypothetical protein